MRAILLAMLLLASPTFATAVARAADADPRDDAVAVVADHLGAAKKGLAALLIEWDNGPNATLSTEDIARELESGTLKLGAVAGFCA